MAFGGFAPMPLRLGGDMAEGWPAEAHARLCADLVAIKRTLPLAVFTLSTSGSTVTIGNFLTMSSDGVGTSQFPTAAYDFGDGSAIISFPKTYIDTYGVERAFGITSAIGSGIDAGGTAIRLFFEFMAPHKIRVSAVNIFEVGSQPSTVAVY